MASWKKVVVQSANITDAALTVTAATVDMAADSVVIVDATDSKLKSDSVADFASGLAGTDTATGLTASNGVLALDHALGNITTLTPASDKIIVYDADGGDGSGGFGTALVSSIGNAGTDTNTTYSLSSSVTNNEASLVLTDSNDPVTTDTIKFSGDSDITLTQSGSADSEDIAISLDAAIDGVTSISNTNLTLTSANLALQRDSDNEINLATDNIIKMKVDAANRVEFTASTIEPTTNDQISLGTADSKEFKDAHFSGNVTAGTMACTTFTGALTGLASKAAAVVTTASSDSGARYLTFVDDATTQDSAAGGSTLEVAAAVSVVPSTGILTASGFAGDLVGDVTGTASDATSAANAVGVSLTDASTTASAHNLVLATASSGTGNALAVDTNLSYNPSTDTLSVTNIEISGTEIKVNTENLTVTDKLIEIAVGSTTSANASGSGLLVEIGAVAPDPTANSNAGNDAEVAAEVAKMPELKWSDGGQLTGWTISDYKSDGPNTDFGIAVNHVNAGAPADDGVAAVQAGQGAFYTDTTNNDLYVYL